MVLCVGSLPRCIQFCNSHPRLHAWWRDGPKCRPGCFLRFDWLMFSTGEFVVDSVGVVTSFTLFLLLPLPLLFLALVVGNCIALARSLLPAIFGHVANTRSNSFSVPQFCSSPCPCNLCCLSSSRHRSPCRLVLSCCEASLTRLLDTVRCVAGTEESLLSSLRRLSRFCIRSETRTDEGALSRKRTFFIDTLKRSPEIGFPLANVLLPFVQCDLTGCEL